MMDVIDRLEPITLAGLNEAASLMTRVDRKYIVPPDLLAETLADLASRAGPTGAEPLRVLQIGDDRIHAYRSTYFDTPEFDFFRHHVQRRRHRAKVRTRTYSSGDQFLEVKTKGGAGETVKHRMRHDPAPHRLDEASAQYISQELAAGRVTGVRALMPVVDTLYDRVTLTRGGNRITCDLSLRFVNDGRVITGPPDVLVETKSAGRSGEMDAELRRRGIRPVSVSKYCLGMALHYPHLPANPWHRLLTRYFPPSYLRPSYS